MGKPSALSAWMKRSVGAPAKAGFVVMEDIGVMPVDRGPRVVTLRGDAADLGQLGVQVGRVAGAGGRLLRQAAQLLAEHRPLPLAQAVVGAVDEVRVEPLAGHAPAVVDRAGDALQLGAVGDDHAALAGGHQLGCLEAECADIADGADLRPRHSEPWACELSSIR